MGVYSDTSEENWNWRNNTQMHQSILQIKILIQTKHKKTLFSD